MEEKRKDTGTPPPGYTTSASAEAPPSEPPTSRRRGGAQKRKASALGSGSTSTPTTSSKRQTREKTQPVPFPPIHNGPLTRARQQPNTVTGPAAWSGSAAGLKSEVDAAAPPKGSGGFDAAKAAEEEVNELKKDWEALEAKIEAEYDAIKSRDANAHLVPTHAGWFSWSKIHPLEEKMLVSFFNGKSESRTSETYMEIRNWIMKKYHANPSTQMELKDLSELSVGDMDARQEVMEFLEYWGLINFHPVCHSDSAPMSIDTDADKEAKADSLINSLFRFEAETSYVPMVPNPSVTTPAFPSGLYPDSALTEELVKSEGPSVEYHCNSCSGDCSRKRYHCQKQADFDLCTECFNNGKFGSDMSPSDFILMEPAEAGGASGGKWTDQETLLLLEALELYKENWNEIAEHVATKTKAQCILHFVEMPIEETFVDSDDQTSEAPKENATAFSLNDETSVEKDTPETTESKDCTNENQPSSCPVETLKPEDVSESNVSTEISENFPLKALREAFEAVGCLPSPGEQLSFADAGNPVMTLSAFLVRLVEPNIATATVRSSLKSISGNSSGELLATRHCFLLEDPPEDKKESTDSERVTTEAAEQGVRKDENQNNVQKEEMRESTDDQNDSKFKQEKPKSVTDCTNLSNNQTSEVDKYQVIEKESSVLSSNDVSGEKSGSMKDDDGLENQKKPELCNLNELDNPDSTKEQHLSNPEESDVTARKGEHSRSAKGSGDATAVDKQAQFAEALKDGDVVSGTGQLNTSNAVVGNEGSKDSRDDNNEKRESSEANEKKDLSEANENKENLVAKTDVSIDKIKRAAITALSAAAVKAKFLAREEEEHIRKLATVLIEKQLYKLETKLAFFNEMETVVMRVREQLERSKQRLFQERAQIIATRLGTSAPSSRPIMQSSQINRAAMAFANLAPRPQFGGTAPRPPNLRPMIGPTAFTNSLMPAAVAGSSMQPSNQDKR